ncbi:hypothetical protein TNCV_4577381 [Trichonephila clavipes]|nr:hypothetical protein TNCV_4577381 [Trichonephila clavipes]
MGSNLYTGGIFVDGSLKNTPLHRLCTPANEDKISEKRRKFAGVCLRNGKARQLGFLRLPSKCARNNFSGVFHGGLEDGEIQRPIRMADVQNLKSVQLYALELEATTQARFRDRHSIQGAKAAFLKLWGVPP